MNNYTYLVLIYFVAFLIALEFAVSTHVFGAEPKCASPQVVNTTPTWDARDESTLRSAKEGGCARHFSDMPCLKIFIKKGERSYSAICGVAIK